ncbi:molybdate ABC transporter substrate-binding protein [uncultured Shimia sp.]|uniref:molybdate ABC transporter substrate-binding protein n=1 Tax=uncultured Shimia sp. TaxID=573152 RepID=UPI0025FA3804|nr:molybdate ABC transporter substrate-binding protein [uncultured Shimia sp.]
MLRSYLSVLVLATGIFGAAVSPIRAEQISIFAAASLHEAVSDIISRFEEKSGHMVTASFAGSSTLARQIAYGAPVDVVMLANVNWMTYLDDKGLLAENSQSTIFGNELVLVVPADAAVNSDVTDSSELSELLKTGKLAMALVEAVPAGIYGKEVLQSLGLWEATRPKVVETDNVRAALALVALGEVAAGIVYATDAAVNDRVRIVARFSAGLHSEIVYPAAVITGQDRPEVVEFMDYMESDAAKDAFANRGFVVLEGTQ